MRKIQSAFLLMIIASAICFVHPQVTASAPRLRGRERLEHTSEVSISAAAQQDSVQRICPDEPKPSIVPIMEADPQIDREHHDLMRQTLIEAVATPNTTVLLGPNVVLDFSDVVLLPVAFAACVTLTSASAIGPDDTILDATPARTPHSLGPVLNFGPHRGDDDTVGVFLLINCEVPDPPSDNVTISGFRLFGPSFGQQSAGDIGIQIRRCLNIEISNMEIAGWGEQGIQVVDEGPPDGPGQEQPNHLPGDRIGRPEQVRIFNNYIHHNQQPRSSFDSHAGGYGVQVTHGAWAQIYENVFDFNRHAIEAGGDAGGYDALRNLVLKGGGVHFPNIFGTDHTHQFDIHGTNNDGFKDGFGGQAGVKFEYAYNSFQYLAAAAIAIRGTPLESITIHDNVFAHEGLEDDDGDDAIYVHDRDDLEDGTIHLGPNNTINFDSYGRYGVCDFDGDRIDDLFLATGQTWWYSSMGEFQWTYLSERIERLNQVKLGYFDDDKRCDVLTESGADWVIASGGIGPWQSIGAFGASLGEVVFGRFDPAIRDHRPGRTRRTTHAFWRTQSEEWLVTPLAAPAWQRIGGSSFPMSRLRFGDFTGDGVTDVLAVQDGHWSISSAALSPWQTLNPSLSDDVGTLYIADLNNNNIDDLIRLEIKTKSVSSEFTYTWWVSDDGRTPWRQLKSYTLSSGTPVFGYAGRFGVAPGGGVLLIDNSRLGQFFSEAEIARGAPPAWTSLFRY